MAVKKQLSIVQENRIGNLSKICLALTRKRINILGCCIHDVHDFGVLRLVVDNPGRARQALKREKVLFTATDVVAVEMSHEPGALGKVAKKLAAERINIDYAYACGAGEKALGIFKVSDTAKADRLLSGLKY